MTAYEQMLGWGTNSFTVSGKQIDIHSAGGLIHSVRVPMLAHSLCIKFQGELLPGAQGLFDYIKTDQGWNQRRVAVVCALCCTGPPIEKAQYLMKMYGTNMRMVAREDMVELVADAVHIALNLIPKGAEEFIAGEDEELALRIGRYSNLLKNSVDDLCVYLLAESFNSGYSFMMTETFYQKVCGASLKCLCNGSLLRKLGARLAKQNRDLIPEETCDSSTIKEPDELSDRD